MINKNIKIGQLNKLRVDRITDQGLYLTPQEIEESILLPNRYVEEDMLIDSELVVFVYTDSEDRLISTTLTPHAMLDEFAALKVVDEQKFGLFLDWGLPKDLLLPKNKQRRDANIGDTKVVKIVKDELTNRLIAVEKFSSYLEKDTSSLEKNQQVEAFVYEQTPLGFKVIVNNLYDGMIFESEIFEEINIGDKKTAFVKNIRDDKKLDISLQAIGVGRLDVAQNKVLEILQEKKFVPLTSKSDADDIKELFGLSKKAFKSSLQALKEKKLIELKVDGIALV